MSDPMFGDNGSWTPPAKPRTRPEPITFHATVDKVQTLANGSIRVALDIDGIEADQALKLVKLKGHMLGVAIVKED